MCVSECVAPPRGPRAPPMGEGSPANWRWQLSIKRRPAINHPPLPERRRHSLWRMDGASGVGGRDGREAGRCHSQARPNQESVLQPRLYLPTNQPSFKPRKSLSSRLKQKIPTGMGVARSHILLSLWQIRLHILPIVGALQKHST